MALLLINLLAGEQVAAFAAFSSGIKTMGILGLALSAQGARNEGSMAIEMASAGRLIMHHNHSRDLALHNANTSLEPGELCDDNGKQMGSNCVYCDEHCQSDVLKKISNAREWKPCHKVEGWIACPGHDTKLFGYPGTEFIKCGKLASNHGKKKYSLPLWKNEANKPAGCFMELTSWRQINDGGDCVPCKYGAQIGGAPTDATLSWLPMYGKNGLQYSVWGRSDQTAVVNPAVGWKRWGTLLGRAAVAPIRRIKCWMNDHPIATSLIKVGSIIAIGALTAGSGAFVAAVVWAGVAIAANTWQTAEVLSDLNPEVRGWARAACVANTWRKWVFAISLDVATCVIPFAEEAGTNVPWTEVHEVVKEWMERDAAIAQAVMEGVNAAIADAETTIEQKIEEWVGRKMSTKEGWWAKVSCTGVEDAAPSNWDPIGLESFQINVNDPDKYAISVRDRYGDPERKPPLPDNCKAATPAMDGQPHQYTCHHMRSLIVAEETENMDLSGSTAERILPVPDGVVGFDFSGDAPWPYSAFPGNDNYIGDRRMASDLDWEMNQIWPQGQRRLSEEAFSRMAQAYYYYIAVMDTWKK